MAKLRSKRLNEKFIFQHFICKVYVYQGRFLPGADNSGLSDPYVQVVLGNYSVNSRVSTIFFFQKCATQ